MARETLITLLFYGLALALGAGLLAWLDHVLWMRANPHAAAITIVAGVFLGLGAFVGARAFQRHPPATVFEPNMAALASLGISAREHEVLNLVAAGRSNKEIAAALGVSPNTVKTHVARLYEKLEAKRRTDAVLKARELGLLR